LEVGGQTALRNDKANAKEKICFERNRFFDILSNSQAPK
jgi:hypothetical protein